MEVPPATLALAQQRAAFIAKQQEGQQEIPVPLVSETMQINVADFVKENLTCSICSQLFYKPITLLCQHTFCHSCLQVMERAEEERQQAAGHFFLVGSSMNNKHHCPICQARFFLPPAKMRVHNYVLQHLVEQFVTDPNYFAQRENEDRKRDPALADEIKEELRQELLPVVLEALDPNGCHGFKTSPCCDIPCPLDYTLEQELPPTTLLGKLGKALSVTNAFGFSAGVLALSSAAMTYHNREMIGSMFSDMVHRSPIKFGLVAGLAAFFGYDYIYNRRTYIPSSPIERKFMRRNGGVF